MHTHQVWGACGDCFEDGGGLALAMGSMVVMIMVGLRSRCGLKIEVGSEELL